MHPVATGEDGPVGAPVARKERVEIAPVPRLGLRGEDVSDLFPVSIRIDGGAPREEGEGKNLSHARQHKVRTTALKSHICTI